MDHSWVANYGLESGLDGVHEHPDFGAAHDFFRTNRHGAFTYRVDFKVPTRIEANFDFWEQWGRSPGQRVFDLEVTWDGVTWSRVSRVDPAALNGGKPFSIVISRANVSMMRFRLLPVKDDIPMLQGLRLRKL